MFHGIFFYAKISNPIMKIIIDFTKHKSNGNVFGETSTNNERLFEEAETFYKKYKVHMEESILNALEWQGAPVGGSISIRTLYYPGSNFIKSMNFIVDEIGLERCNLSLEKITT